MNAQLPFTAFEELMLAQDSAAYPCNIYVRMRLRGELDQNHFTAAVNAMIANNPLLRARIETRFGRSKWLIQEVAEQVIRWRNASVELQNIPEESQFDLYREFGLQIEVASPSNSHNASDSRTLVAIKLHHAVADGLGIIDAVHDLWSVYDDLVNGRVVKHSGRHGSSLAVRNRFVSSISSFIKLIPRQLVGLAGVRQFLMRKPAPILNHKPPKDDEFEPLRFASVVQQFTESDTENMRLEAKRRSISMNEMLAACVFRGCAQFRADCGEQSNSEWLRMMVPISLRNTSELQKMSACNVVSSIFLDRQPSQIANFESLTQDIHEEMELIKNNRLALMFILSIWIKKQLTFRTKKSKHDRCQTSMVFSNLGKLFLRSPLLDKSQRLAPGNTTIESFEIFAPISRYMCTAFTVLIYGQRLVLMLRYDPRFVKSNDAQKLLDSVTNQMTQLISAEALTC